MNSLNIISARVSPPQTPAPSRSNSLGNILSAAVIESRRNSRGTLLNEKAEGEGENTPESKKENGEAYENTAHEETPLLEKTENQYANLEPSGWRIIPRLSRTLLDSIRWVLSTLAAPGVYLIAFLYDESGRFAPFSQIRKLGAVFSVRPSSALTNEPHEVLSEDDGLMAQHRNGKSATGRRGSLKSPRPRASNSSLSSVSSESESEPDGIVEEVEQPMLGGSTRHTRSKAQQISDDNTPTRRSIRIKLNNDDSLRQRKQRKLQPSNTQSNGSGAISPAEISPAALKSPTSTAAALSLTKYPKAPAPPRPLIPRRQPSYALPESPNGRLTQKTLILDLDETLIHSMAKGGRMSTGHMVEVKLNTLVGAGGATTLGPQHPILYYVHKRPHCDDFLRRVSRPLFLQFPYAEFL
jgi:CTD nuclear envelope phosphatase 1